MLVYIYAVRSMLHVVWWWSCTLPSGSWLVWRVLLGSNVRSFVRAVVPGNQSKRPDPADPSRPTQPTQPPREPRSPSTPAKAHLGQTVIVRVPGRKRRLVTWRWDAAYTCPLFGEWHAWWRVLGPCELAFVRSFVRPAHHLPGNAATRPPILRACGSVRRTIASASSACPQSRRGTISRWRGALLR